MDGKKNGTKTGLRSKEGWAPTDEDKSVLKSNGGTYLLYQGMRSRKPPAAPLSPRGE